MTGAWVVQADEAETVARPALQLLADASHTGGLLGANRLHLEPGEPGTKPHYHARSAEAFYVLAGTLRMLIGAEVITVRQGGYAVVPAGVRHAFAAPPDSPADVLITLVPGVERFGYFRRLPEILRGDLAEEEVTRIHEQYDVHFVDGPDWDAAGAGQARD
ncbi:cupin domain-containing protein [Amycolatopsis thermalba]|uniref:Cupin domain-containing protein n=1 Tax=Amycolatopsis thermalba TaxID=944492 RepID=A0ABY4NVH1_9PSEU|nr:MULTISPECIES: cupin domain-containing protein [Amycolatopsis]UQS24069.1 cupin domain-containing protein [Amycolatopsis thermalba]